MRKVLVILLAAAVSVPVFAQVKVFARRVASGGTANLMAETFSLDVAGTGTNYDNAWTESNAGGTTDPDAAATTPAGGSGGFCGGFTGETLKLTAGVFDEPETWVDFGAAQAGEVDFRGYLYIDSEDIAVSTVTTIMLVDNATAPNVGSGTPVVRIELGETSGDQLQLGFVVATASGPAGTFNVTTGTCYLVEMKWNDATNAVSARVNSTDVFVDSTTTDPGASSEFMVLGVESTDNATIYWDKIGIGNTGYIGP